MLLRALVGWLARASYTGQLLLIDRLRRHGIDPGILPPTYLAELIAEEIRVLRLTSQLTRSYWKSELVDRIDEVLVPGIAYLVDQRLPRDLVMDDLTCDLRPLLIARGVDIRPLGC
jgi:hypothetical protein